MSNVVVKVPMWRHISIHVLTQSFLNWITLFSISKNNINTQVPISASTHPHILSTANTNLKAQATNQFCQCIRNIISSIHYNSLQSIPSNCDILEPLRIKIKMFVVWWEWIQAPACSRIEPVLMLFMRERKHHLRTCLGTTHSAQRIHCCWTDSSRQGSVSHHWIIKTPLNQSAPQWRQRRSISGLLYFKVTQILVFLPEVYDPTCLNISTPVKLKASVLL